MTTRRSFLATLTAVSLAPALARASTTRKGMFSGRSRHETKGWVEVTDRTVALQRDFSLDRAPDPVVGLGNNGRYDPATFMGELVSKKGASSYAIPDGIDASAYNEVYIWCRAADVPLGIAKIS